MKKMIMILTVSIIIFFGFLFFSESEFLINNKKITPDKSENILPQGKITQYNSTGWRGIPLFLNGTGYDPDGIITLYEWDFNGDGKYDWNSTVIGTTYHTYNKTGFFNASFRITDNDNGIVSYTLKVEIIDLIYSTPDIKIFGDWNENTVSELIYINGTTSNDNLNDSLLNIFLLIGNSNSFRASLPLHWPYFITMAARPLVIRNLKSTGSFLIVLTFLGILLRKYIKDNLVFRPSNLPFLAKYLLRP